MNGDAVVPSAYGGMAQMSYLTPAFLMSAMAHGPEIRNGDLPL